MTILNEASKIYLGSQVVDTVYAGSTGVWPPTAPWTPATLPGLAIWFDASQLGLADGAIVASWPNLANAAKPGVILDASATPLVRANAKNGLPVVAFRINQARLRMTGTGVDKDYTLVYVAHLSGYNVGRIVTAAYPPSNLLFGWWYQYEDVAYSTGPDGFFQPNLQKPAYYPGSWKMYSGDGASSPAYLPRLFSNGVLLSQSTGATDGWMGLFNISGYGPTGLEETCDCEVAEVVLYNRKLSDDDRQLVEAYLRAKWGFGAPALLTPTLLPALPQEPMVIPAIRP